MPPRIQPTRLPQPSTCQCLRTRSQSVPAALPQQRSFHASPQNEQRYPPRRQTILRHKMFDWLNGPGKVFRDPLAGSTNYLSAYDKTGKLRRQGRGPPRAQVQEDAAESEEDIQLQEEEDGVNEAERASRAKQRAADRAAREAQNSLPRERDSDLRPYPLNQSFKSQSVLSEELREEIYRSVVKRRMDAQAVSAAFGVDMRRVAAVVRLKTIEKQWQEEDKPLAKPYNDAVLKMLPKTPYNPSSERMTAHESINDLPVHPATRQQLFYPASESRQFTREDAAKAFSPTLLPADKRIPHPELIMLEKWNLENVSRETRVARLHAWDKEERAKKEEQERKQKDWEERTQRVVSGRRWDFKFQDFSAETVGKDERSRKGVGYRYGMPHTDRKRGQVKIPNSVE